MEHSQLLPRFSQVEPTYNSFQSQQSHPQTLSTSISNRSIRLLYGGFKSSGRIRQRKSLTRDSLELLGKSISSKAFSDKPMPQIHFSSPKLYKRKAESMREKLGLKDEGTQFSPPRAANQTQVVSSHAKSPIQDLLSASRGVRRDFEKSKYFIEPHRLGVEFNCWGGVRHQLKRKPQLRSLHYSPYL